MSRLDTPETLLVAELDNRVIGFLFGRAGDLEFGLPGTVAWIETIGVDPAYRRRRVAEALVEQFASSAEDHGIKTIFTLMNTNQTELQYFFQSNRLCPRENDSLSIRFIGLTPDAVAIFPSQKGPAPWILSCRKN